MILKEEHTKNDIEGKRLSDRVMSVRLHIEGVIMNVVSDYAPRVRCLIEEKEKFWIELNKVVESIFREQTSMGMLGKGKEVMRLGAGLVSRKGT